MRRIIILKVGSTHPSLRSKRGDFEDWILSGLEGTRHDRHVIDVRNGSALPNYGEIAGLVITGSHAMVTEHATWSERTAQWLPGAVERGIPILGICYGHQLLAYALGGEVGNNPKGCEYGTIPVHLDTAASGDALLGGLSTPMQVHEGHIQSVLRLPEQARHLASSPKEPNEAFIVGESAWGVQFHPEFDAEIVKGYITHDREALLREGQDVGELLAACVDTPYGGEVFKRFVAVVNKRLRYPMNTEIYRPRMRIRKLVIGSIILLILAGSAVLGYRGLVAGLPSLDALPDRLSIPSVRITDRNGQLLYELLAESGGRHVVLPLESIPLNLRQATIATEDKSFYANPGFDLVGILRALWINFRGGETLSGGSTITQQVARNLLLDPEERGQRSLRRKLREAILAWQLTRRLSKDEILALYLNQTYYGGLAYGVEAAAQTYFGKSAAQLDLAESALLAGLPQAPARYNPFTDLEAAQRRQRVVLSLMQEAGFITGEQGEAAGREPLVLAATPYPILAPHFVMMVRAQLDRLFTPDEIYQHGGLVVRTSLDMDWQGIAERAIARQLSDLQRGEAGLGHNVNNAALVALDPQNGEILALVGSPDYFDAAHAGSIDMVTAPRQPGSALKPIVYATALDPARPDAWTAATMLLDVSTSFLTHEGLAYTPANYDQKEHGPVLVRQALASSLNIPAVITLDHVGLGRLFEQANRMGITTLQDPQRYDLSLALGGGEVSLLELTAAYGAFASGGFRVDPVSILEVSDINGTALYAAPPAPRERVLDERVAWLISDILSDNDARRLGFGANSILRLDRPAAVKTGTTSNFHDNWTVGYTPDLVVGVWAGNTSYEPMREVNGLTGAAPIWHQFIRAVLTGRPPLPFVQPRGLVQVEVCELSGWLPTPACPYRRREWFIDGTQPTVPDTLFRQVQVDRLTGLLAGEDTPPERRTTQTVLDLPPQAAPSGHAQGLRLLADLLSSAQSADGSLVSIEHPSQSQAPLRLVSPAQGSIYRLVAGYTPAAQRVLLEAVGEAGLQDVSLWVDGNLIQRFDREPFQAWWQLAAGTHQTWAQGKRPDGEQVASEHVTFEVK